MGLYKCIHFRDSPAFWDPCETHYGVYGLKKETCQRNHERMQVVWHLGAVAARLYRKGVWRSVAMVRRVCLDRRQWRLGRLPGSSVFREQFEQRWRGALASVAKQGHHPLWVRLSGEAFLENGEGACLYVNVAQQEVRPLPQWRLWWGFWSGSSSVWIYMGGGWCHGSIWR